MVNSISFKGFYLHELAAKVQKKREGRQVVTLVPTRGVTDKNPRLMVVPTFIDENCDGPTKDIYVRPIGENEKHTFSFKKVPSSTEDKTFLYNPNYKIDILTL